MREKRNLYFLAFTVVLAFLQFSCSKEEGKGGLATIKGKVYGYDINTSGVITDSAYVGNARVSISYGDHAYADDDTRTSYTGEYAFTGLQKGKYTIYVYSQCDSCPFNQEVRIQQAEITDKKQELVLPDFVIYD